MHCIAVITSHIEFTLLVTAAAGAIYVYAWLLPTILWALLWWRHDTVGANITEVVCIYGYSLSIYVPISVNSSNLLFS